jgi:copper chaperone CopZ
MKKIYCLLLVFMMLNAHGQVKKITLQASGLTCSMCSKAINKALSSITYVDKVIANIRTSSFDITLKQDANFNFDDFKKKVEDAGFSVANMEAIIDFNNTSVANDNHVKVAGMVFHFLNVKSQVLSGNQHIRILDKGFVSAKEYKSNSRLTSMECYKTGTASSCCAKEGLASGTRIYHVTVQ